MNKRASRREIGTDARLDWSSVVADNDVSLHVYSRLFRNASHKKCSDCDVDFVTVGTEARVDTTNA